MHKLIVFILLLSINFCFAQQTKKSNIIRPIYAAIIIDNATGRILCSYNAHKLTYPASLTKMMTLYLLFERLEKRKINLNTALYISQKASKQQPCKIYLQKGKTISVLQAIKSIIVKSANDSSMVVAENLAGSEIKFVHLMNQKAKEIGMTKTVFGNSSGLPNPHQVTTAYDMLILARALYKNFPNYYHYFSCKTMQYGKNIYHSHNKLMHKYYYVDGIKTGYIRKSGYNIATSAKRKGVRLIGVIMGGKSSTWRNNRMYYLLNQSFNKILGNANAHVGLPTQFKLLSKPKIKKTRNNRI